MVMSTIIIDNRLVIKLTAVKWVYKWSGCIRTDLKKYYMKDIAGC